MRKLIRYILPFAAFLTLEAWAGYPAIAVGTWYRVPNSKLDSCGCLPGTIPAPGGTAYRDIFAAWGGGAYDPDSNRLLVAGGGHTNYSGNEVYSFSIDSLKWFRIKGPGSVVTYNTGSEYYNNPADSQSIRAQHSKGRLQACPGSNKLYYLGTIDMYSDADGGSGNHLLNLATRNWSRPSVIPTDPGNGGYSYGAYPISGYDSVTNRIYFHGMAPSFSWLFSIRCTDDSLASHGGFWTDDLSNLAGGSAGNQNGAVDVKRRRFYTFGDGRAAYWAITTPGTNSTHVVVTPTGSTSITNAVGPGLDYSSVDTTLVGYHGGDTVFTFNSVTNVWTAVPPSGSNTVHPPTQQTSGTFGRWRYVKNGNFFIYAHSADSAVYMYRLSAAPSSGGGSGSLLFRGVGN